MGNSSLFVEQKEQELFSSGQWDLFGQNSSCVLSIFNKFMLFCQYAKLRTSACPAAPVRATEALKQLC